MNAPIAVTAPDRSTFLGGSDAAAVMGVSPWSTPVELWQKKTGRAKSEAPDVAASKRYERGHKLEPFIRDMVIDKLVSMGLAVELAACNARYIDPDYSFMSCEIDFELRLTGTVAIGDSIVVFENEHINADAKSVTGFARKKWGVEDTEDVPIEYAAQFMFGLMVTGRRYCLVAALRSFDDVDVYWTVRDDETIQAMRPKLASFWIDHILADVPPDPLLFADIKALFPSDNGLSKPATQEIADRVQRLRDVKAQIKSLEEAEKALQFDIAEFISPFAALTYQGKEIATWKGQSTSRLDQKALAEAMPEIAKQFTTTSTIRVLRLKK
jgi:predicted phage-related endonuclease